MRQKERDELYETILQLEKTIELKEENLGFIAGQPQFQSEFDYVSRLKAYHDELVDLYRKECKKVKRRRGLLWLLFG